MAVGVIYTELDLDYSRFEKNQRKLLQSATQTSLSVEKNWQTLAAKSDVIYQAMANSAINAYNMIANRAKTSAEEQFRAQSALVAKINSLNQEVAKNPLYETLGIRSVAAIEAQKSAVIASYDTIKQHAQKGSQDWINIEHAKNAKLKELNREMVGDHEMSMASMTRAVLRFYAAYYVISAVAGFIGRAFMDGVTTIDKMQLSAVTVAATITNLQDTSGSVAENYKKNLEYAKSLVPVLMQIDAASLANLEQVQLINNAMAMHGVILDGNNKKQVESATALTNAIAMYTVGQNKEQQATQETNALLNGEVTTRNRIALMIDQMIRRQGDYKGGLKGLNAEAAKHGGWLERISPYLVGIAAASGDISKTWEAVSSSLKTTWMILQTEMFADFYKGLVTGGQEAIGWFRENAPDIGKYFRIAMNMVGDSIKVVFNLLKGFAPIFQDLGQLMAPIVYGWGGVLAALVPVSEAIGNLITMTYALGKAIVSTAMAGSRIAVFDYEGAKLYWDEAKKGYAETYGLIKKNFNLISTGVADAVVKYDLQYKAAKKAAGSGYLPEVKPGQDPDKAAKEKSILADLLGEYRKNYEREIEMADHAAKMKELAGQNELNFALDVINQKERALNNEYSASVTAINNNVKDERKRGAELTTLYADYSKRWQKFEDQKEEKTLQVIEFQKKSWQSYYAWDLQQRDKVLEDERTQGGKRVKVSEDVWDAIGKYKREFGRMPTISEAEEYRDLEKEAKERLAAERDVYKDLRGYAGDYYEATKKMIDEQAKAYRDLGVDETAVAAWVTEELYKADIQRLKQSDKFFDGWKAGLKEMQHDAMTWGQAGNETFKTFASESKSTLSTVLFDGIKGDLKSFQDYWFAFYDALLKKFTDIVANMVVEWLLGQQTMKLASAAWSGISSLAGAGLSAIGGMFGGGGGGAAAATSAPTYVTAMGNAFYGGRPLAFANGAAFTNGIYDRPTFFPMAKGYGVMGEVEPEAVMPLKRTRSGKLGVAMEGGGGGTSNIINVPLTINAKGKITAAQISDLRSTIEEVTEKKIRSWQ